ncbi:MAG: monofunctional biosynthetic peptidoglycan transglycosylase [Geminicoccaceae bacterium]|nr:monofunctional biosynthetic peptidoglycan transglycosylase [Geminicoccaceae bacterium]
MPWRPARAAADRRASATPSDKRKATGRTFFGRLRRWLLVAALFVLLAPAALIAAYGALPVPLTPLMVIRLTEGHGLTKDWVPLERIAPALPRSVVAAEDNLFCSHFGFDLEALKGEVEDWLAGEPVRGASTITMQTAKNLFLWPDRSLFRKALEAWLTPQIELLWPKRRILEVYLNIVEFGSGVYGAEAAARHHFDKPAADLSAAEAARLAAVLPNPLRWSASRPGDYVIGRTATIRTRVEQLGPMLDCVPGG